MSGSSNNWISSGSNNGSPGRSDHDGDGGEFLSHLGSESQSERLIVESSVGGINGKTSSGGNKSIIGSSTFSEGDQLLLVKKGVTGISSGGEVVVSEWANLGSAVNSGPGGITDTGTRSGRIPSSGDRGWSLSTNSKSTGVVVEDGGIGKFLHVFASTMSGAIIWTDLSGTSLSGESSQTGALSGLSVANSLGGTLSVLMDVSGSGRGINPG